MQLSQEQQLFIEKVKAGHNVLVDACIGSGKTTSIQKLCDELPNRKILYLTYNKLLKLDAQERIKNFNTKVTNYHGFVYPYLLKAGIKVGYNDSLRAFSKLNPKLGAKYDLLIIDEYQDISTEISEVLEVIKAQLPNLQIVMVGDMAQKIYDTSTLDVPTWMKGFLGKYEQVDFTQCFRIGPVLAKKLSMAWDKKINGVNDNQQVYVMTKSEALGHMMTLETKDFLVLGANKGIRIDMLNDLQDLNPKKFNKYTTYSSMSNQGESNVLLQPDVAPFITYDKCKGMERRVCFVTDYDESFLEIRARLSSNVDIIRNVFLVAASRGKDEIIFVVENIDQKYELEKTLVNTIGGISVSTFRKLENAPKDHGLLKPATMFDYIYNEDLFAAYDLLKVEEIEQRDNTIIETATTDGNLEISSAIGLYAEAAFFKNIDVADMIRNEHNLKIENSSNLGYIKKAGRLKDYALEALLFQSVKYPELQKNPLDYNLHKKPYETDFNHDRPDIQWELMCLLAHETENLAYIRQVTDRYVTDEAKEELVKRMATKLSTTDSNQISCSLKTDGTLIAGRADVVKYEDNAVYELKFVGSLGKEDFLQCAMYMCMIGLKYGYVWNLKDNSLFKVEIPDRQRFLDTAITASTKRDITQFVGYIPTVQD